MRCMLLAVGLPASDHDVPGSICRNLSRNASTRFRQPDSTVQGKSRPVLYAALRMAAALNLSFRSCLQRGAQSGRSNKYRAFFTHAVRQIDRSDRRLLNGETIPRREKVFSFFGPHTRWISKGKAGCPVELGIPVCNLKGQYGFMLHYEVMWGGSDIDFAVSMVETAQVQVQFPDLRAVSFDCGFHDPTNRIHLDDLHDDYVLPRRPSAPAVESGINKQS